MARDLTIRGGFDGKHAIRRNALPLIEGVVLHAEKLSEALHAANNGGRAGHGVDKGGIIAHAPIGNSELPKASTDNSGEKVIHNYQHGAMQNQKNLDHEKVARGQRLREARERAGLKQAEIARIFQISRNAVGMWESGENTPSADKIPRLAKELQVTSDWLWSGQGEMVGTASTAHAEPIDGTGKANFAYGLMPLLGTAQGGDDGLVEWNGEVVDYVPRPPELAGAKGAYSIYITGKSMEPRYFEGERANVNPSRPVLPESFVNVQFYKDDAGGTPYAWVKQFVSRNDKFSTFKQFNPPKLLKIPTKDILAVHVIVGAGQI